MSPTTVDSYKDDLKKFIEFVESRRGKGLMPGEVTPQMIQDILDFLASSGYRTQDDQLTTAVNGMSLTTG